MKKTFILAATIATICTPSFARTVVVRDLTPEEKTNYYFDLMDINNDGLVSPREHADFARHMFDQTDANEDGYITYDELLAEKRAERARIREVVYTYPAGKPPVKLPNRTNANPSDHSINRSTEWDEPNSRYLSK